MTPASGAVVATISAIKASGVLVSVSPEDFKSVLRRQDQPLVVHAEGGVFSRKHKYLTSYKGLAFYTKTDERLHLASTTELVEAKKITMPEV